MLRRYRHSALRRRLRGIVLPVVLVMLVLMTIVVLFLTRRGVVDEQLAFNARGVVTLETSAQYALRWCELWLWTSPPGFVQPAGRSGPPRTMPAPAAPTVAWRDPANWANFAVSLPQTLVTGNLQRAQCLIEDAADELIASELPDGNRLPTSFKHRKFRLTVEVESLEIVNPLGLNQPCIQWACARAQSEVRMDLD